MLEPLVSICMAAYNAENYIGEAINSIVNQTYQNWELIIINDGSTDNTDFEIKRIDDKRITTYYQQNKGQCAALNEAFRTSKGQLIKFMDADDIISPNFLKNQVAVVSSNTIASASWGRFYKNDLGTFKLEREIIQTYMTPISWLVESMTDKHVMMQCALWLIPRDILESSGLWNEELSLINDFEFFIRVLLHAKKIKYANDAILYYRSGLNNSLSNLKSRKGAESYFNSIDWGMLQLLNYENSPRIKKIAANYYQYFVYDFYPVHLDLIQKAEKKIKELGGSSNPFPSGGYTKALSKIIGWKACKKIKYRLKIKTN